MDYCYDQQIEESINNIHIQITQLLLFLQIFHMAQSATELELPAVTRCMKC